MSTLTEAEVRAAKPKDKPYKLSDGRGLFLFVAPGGGRLWRLRYWFDRREKLLSLGSYPEISLKRAREKREDARRLVAEGVDPSAQRRAAKAVVVHTFEAIAREWLALQENRLSSSTLERERNQLERFIFPELGRRPVNDIAAHEVLLLLRRIEARGIHDTAHRTRSTCSRVFRFGVATGRATRDVTADLRGALAPVTKRHLAAITEPHRIGQLLRAINGYMGQTTTHIALQLAPLVFVRPGELRGR